MRWLGGIIKLSKSDYVLGVQCPLALWYKKHRKDLKLPVTEEQQALFDQGHLVGTYAHRCYPGGAAVNAPFWSVERGIEQTHGFVQEGFSTIYEACAIAPDGCHARIDILRSTTAHSTGGESDGGGRVADDSGGSNGALVSGGGELAGSGSDVLAGSGNGALARHNTWQMIEVKSSTVVKPHQLIDLAFQHYVFTQAGYVISSCHLLLINKHYQRDGDIVATQLLQLHDVTEQVVARSALIGARAHSLQHMLASTTPPHVSIGEHCSIPYACPYMHVCWKDVPEYSVFNVFPGEVASRLYATYGADLHDIPPHEWKESKKALDIECYINNRAHVDREQLRRFLHHLEYPLFFLDYETVGSAVPLFDGTTPYQQVPFQFSLHVRLDENTPLLHRQFLHTEQTDPRNDFIRSLIAQCGTEGSIVVYYKEFEQGITNQLIGFAPHYEPQLRAICNRMVDLLVPFRKRALYHPLQNGSASIKSTLPAFTDLSYKELDIKEGVTASNSYLHFMTGVLPPAKHQRLFDSLRQYCALDTMAMVELLSIIERYGSRTPSLF